jgi:D-glycero-D-manno-heptose 1,7-bisphosphate phosphatase
MLESDGNKLKPAVFLDKDGTLIENVPYNVAPELIRLTPRALEGLRMLTASGYLLFIVTNQSGVARGLFTEDDLKGVERHLQNLLAEAGVELGGFYYCPHLPDGKVADYSLDCQCRKPEPGMILRAAEEHDLDISHSWLFGDTLDDVEAGRRAGCRTVMINSGNEKRWRVTPDRIPHYLVNNLTEAAQLMCNVTDPAGFPGNLSRSISSI